MNLPFPSLTPRLVDSRWFSADTPCDEEVEVALIEQKFQLWLTSVGQRYVNMNPLGKIAPEPMEEEAETDEEEGNDDSDDTEDTQDDEDEEEIYAPGADGGGGIFVTATRHINTTAAGGAVAVGDQHTAQGGGEDMAIQTPNVGNNNNDVVMNDSNTNDRSSL